MNNNSLVETVAARRDGKFLSGINAVNRPTCNIDQFDIIGENLDLTNLVAVSP